MSQRGELIFVGCVLVLVAVLWAKTIKAISDRFEARYTESIAIGELFGPRKS